MKVTITNEEVDFLAKMIYLADQPAAVPTEFDRNWVGWVTAPIAQHAITPREAKAMLTIVGILADYEVPVSAIMEVILKEFVINYQNNHSDESLNPTVKLMRQNYSGNVCGLKSFVIYEPKIDSFGVAIKIREDHKKKEPTCPNPLNDLNIVGEPTEV